MSSFASNRPEAAIPLSATIGQSALRPLLPVSANEAFLESGHVIEGRRWPTRANSGHRRLGPGKPQNDPSGPLANSLALRLNGTKPRLGGSGRAFAPIPPIGTAAEQK
jgi:hypothetical protein